MSIKILTGDRGRVAAIYDNRIDRALGPMFYETMSGGSGDGNAEKVAQKFLDMMKEIGTDVSVTALPFLMNKSDDFKAMEWKECPWQCVGSNLIPGKDDACEDCLHSCGICYEEGLKEKTKIVIRSMNTNGLNHERRLRACASCARMLNVRFERPS